MGYGVWQIIAPIDMLWASYERRLLARGEAPLRNPRWERSARFTGWLCAAAGAAALTLCAMAAGIISPSSGQSSGVIIQGRELTQDEWDGCGHDLSACVSRYPPPR